MLIHLTCLFLTFSRCECSITYVRVLFSTDFLGASAALLGVDEGCGVRRTAQQLSNEAESRQEALPDEEPACKEARTLEGYDRVWGYVGCVGCVGGRGAGGGAVPRATRRRRVKSRATERAAAERRPLNCISGHPACWSLIFDIWYSIVDRRSSISDLQSSTVNLQRWIVDLG